VKAILLFLIAVVTLGAGATAALASERSVSLTQDPVVMRLSKDERCASNGCNGVIRYRVDWKAEGGMTPSEIKRVNTTASPRASGAMTVDRQYFDTPEAEHTTDVVKKGVYDI
jgi:hypothetical protein